MNESEPSSLKPIALRGWQTTLFKAISPILVRLSRLRHSRKTARSSPAPGRQLERFEANFSSQQGEDGILREIFFRIGTGERYFAEFGVQDGSECNTALLASEYGWHGLYIEADEEDAKAVRERWSQRPDITVRREFVTAENVAQLFTESGIPADLDLLSIDIDGNDYWVWKALGSYRPRVVVIEYNAAYPPPVKWIMAYDPSHCWDGTTHFGASLSAYTVLASRLGYALIGTDSHGVNAFFLRRDLLAESGFVEATPEQAYHRPRYGTLALPHPFRSGPFVTEG